MSMSAADSASEASGSNSAYVPTGTATQDGGVAASLRNVVGSELCHIDLQSTCQPDDLMACADGAGLPPGTEADAGPNAPSDAGTGTTTDAGSPVPTDGGASPVADGGLLACRVVRRGSIVSPQCTVSGSGHDGDACRASQDCAVGFDCVGNPGQCRRYCCLGSKSCGTDRICDKQTIVGDEAVTVPVCAPIHPCQLLGTKSCPDNQTCAIADQRDGRTSCLTIGSVSVGESCETSNCAAGLTCLGQEGTRTCFKLCVKSRYGDCPTDTKCKGSAPLFTDPDQGVCIKDVATH